MLLKLSMCIQTNSVQTSITETFTEIFLKACSQIIFHHIKATTVEKLKHWIPTAGSQLEVGLYDSIDITINITRKNEKGRRGTTVKLNTLELRILWQDSPPPHLTHICQGSL